jgi:hypothetical protein
LKESNSRNAQGAYRSGSHATEVIKMFPGTRVQLLGPRERDQSDQGFVDWKFMSVLSWGEQPRGTWVLDIIDEVSRITASYMTGALLKVPRHKPDARGFDSRVMGRRFDTVLPDQGYHTSQGPVTDEY